MNNRNNLPICLTVLLAMVLSVAMTGTVRAETTGKTEDGFSYAIEGEAAVITKYSGPETELTIPAMIDGIPVKGIGDRAFYSSSLKSVTIPEGVTSIGKGAFGQSTLLKSVTIPEGLTRIEDEVFRGCGHLTSVAIPEGVKSIGIGAFRDCGGLASVTIPEGVKSIEKFAFYGCSSLKSVTIPSSVTSIGGGAFLDCDNLVVQGNRDSYVIDDSESYYQNFENILLPGAVAGTPSYILQFRENGHLRNMLVHTPMDGVDEYPKKIYDYFSHEKVFDLHKTVKDYSSARMNDKAKNISIRLFQEGTLITHVKLIDIRGYQWFWAFNPDLSEYDYDDWRIFYESLFSPDQRFPRTQELQFRAVSPIPSTRDGEPVPEDVVMMDLSLYPVLPDGTLDDTVPRTVWLLAEQTNEKILDGVVQEGTGYALRELFTGTWLGNPISRIGCVTTSKNLQYLNALLPSYRIMEDSWLAPIRISTDIMKNEWLDGMFWERNLPSDDVGLPYWAGFLKKAQTIGELRRIYEMMPSEYWFIQPEAGPTPTYADRIPNPSEPSTHYVANAAQFADAIDAAKSGETIVLLGDMPIYYEKFTVNNKKLKICGLPGQKPTVYFARENTISDNIANYIVSSDSLFTLDDAAVELRDITLDMSGMMNCFLMSGKSEVRLGSGAEITGFNSVVRAYDHPRIIIDGASIHHNRWVTRSEVTDSINFHMLSGEIAYNSSPYGSVIDTGRESTIHYRKQDSSFVMDGGSIHHNSTFGDSIIDLYSVKKAEINGGEFYRNTASKKHFGSPITVYDSLLTINGGEFYNNAGGLAGCINVGEVSSAKEGSVESSLVMNAGSIHDNLSSEYYLSMNKATDIFVGSYSFVDIFGKSYRSKSSFEMKGGDISRTPGQPEIPSILVLYNKSTCTISSGSIDINTIATMEGGKLVNKLKKK